MISTVQHAYSDCTMIRAEINSNNQKAQQLANEQGMKVAQNVAAGVVGLVIWPVWFGMDFKGAAGQDTANLQSAARIPDAVGCAALARARVSTSASPVTDGLRSLTNRAGHREGPTADWQIKSKTPDVRIGCTACVQWPTAGENCGRSASNQVSTMSSINPNLDSWHCRHGHKAVRLSVG